jgi:hypothetical protein
MSSDGLGNVAPVQKGSGKIHILADYFKQSHKLNDVSDTRCGKLAQQWTRLDDVHCIEYLEDKKSCSICVRMLRDD